jgi:hypothetical protein
MLTDIADRQIIAAIRSGCVGIVYNPLALHNPPKVGLHSTLQARAAWYFLPRGIGFPVVASAS